MSELTIRSLRMDDLDRVSEIENRIAGHPRRDFLEKRFAAAVKDPGSFITCGAMELGNLAGYAFARIQTGEFGSREAVTVLDVIGVDSGAQRNGIGKALLREIEKQSSERRVGILRTQVNWSDHPMVMFFSSAGFRLSSHQVLERDTSSLEEKPGELPQGRHRDSDDPIDLSRDRFLIRSLEEADLAEVVRIDHSLTGRDRSAYFSAKFKEMLTESGIRISLVAEEDGVLAGYIMASVDYGEFGKVDKAAVVDAIGVHSAFAGSGIGHALLSQLLLNLSTLQVEYVRTQVSPEDFDLNRFLHVCGFHQSQRLVLTKPLTH
ncbi:MAG: GNAT family N-acetyltransferase [Holophagaceae bacterium]|nr:GNAT family N-acetyltransferase [Holophagaceae bacterium]